MADISDVLSTLVTKAAAIVYPNGTSQPSVAGVDITVRPGWPLSNELDALLSSGKCHVSVFPTNQERNTTRYPETQEVLENPDPTLEVAVNGNTITFTGVVQAGFNVYCVVSGSGFHYTTQQNDTLTTIATALASQISWSFAGTVNNGPVITVGSGQVEAARIGGFGSVVTEYRRQERVVMITVWAPKPSTRDLVAKPIDLELAKTHWLTMPDGCAARMIYKSSSVSDSAQKAGLYRRDLNYTIEYATTETENAAQVVAPVLTVNSIIHNL